MAGRPRTRARRAAAADAVTELIPEAEPAPAHDAPADVRPRDARTRLRARAPGMGPRTRTAVDGAQADAIGSLTAQLDPGNVVRIERTKPNWCAGWQEDYVLEGGDTGDLLDYLREEYGGRTYRLTIMSAAGDVLWVSKVNIGGQPKEEGRVLERWRYEGLPSPESASHRDQPPPPAPQQGIGFTEIMGVLTMVMESQKDAAAAQLASVQRAVESNNEQTTTLVNHLVSERNSERERQSFGGQLQELVDGTAALKKASSAFGAAAPSDDGDDGDMLKGAAKEAMGHFISNVMASEFGGTPKSEAAARAPRAPRRVVRAQPGFDDIPEAKPR